MKKFLFFLILTLYGHVCLAQSMRGYVKTKGRMVDGKVVHGVGLSGVTIRIKGINVVMSGKDGLFFISLPQNHTGDSIYIELISKPGFELIDRDILNRPIIYNPSTPLTIVMEEESILAEERLAIEKKLRRILLLQLEKAEKEIEELDVTIEEKNRKLQELYKRQSNQEHLINDMVNQYGKYDYDVMSIFDVRVSEYIINGDLEKADSLLKTKGDLKEQLERILILKDEISNLLQKKLAGLSYKADSLHKRGRELVNEGKIAEAEKMYFAAINTYQRLAANNPEAYEPDMAGTQFNLAVLYLDTQRFAEAEKMYLAAMNTYQRLAANNPEAYEPDVARTQNNLGTLYYNTGRYAEAGKMYLSVLDTYRHLAVSNPEAYEPDMAVTQNNLGTLYYNTGKYAEAEKMYRAVLDTYRRLAVSNPEAYEPDVARTQNNLGTLYYNTGRYAEAGKMYLSVLDTYRHLAASNPGVYEPDVTRTQNYLGIIYSCLKEFEKARDCHRESMKYFEQYDQGNEEYPQSILLLAKAEMFNKEYSVSIEHHKEAMVLFDERGMVDYYSDAEQSLKLCYMYAERDYSSLETSAQRDYLLQIAEIENGNYEKTTSVASRLLDELSDDENALKYFNMALEIAVERSGGLGSPDIASTHQNIGKVYNFQGNFSKAIEEYNYALSLQRELMGDSTRHVGQSLMLLGITYNSMKKYDLALDYYKDALNIYENIFKENNSAEIANIYNNMGVTYENKKDNKQALHYYEMALNMRKELYDYEHPDIAYSYSNIAGVYDHMEDYDKAIAYYQKSIDVLKKSKGSKHQDVGLMYNNIAATYYNMDEFDKSLSYFTHALEIMQIFLPDDHPTVRSIVENLETIKKEIERR